MFDTACISRSGFVRRQDEVVVQGVAFNPRSLKRAIRAEAGGISVGLNLTGVNMLETIAILLIVLWAIGLVSSYTMGGLIHVLLVIAIVVILMRVIGGRRA